MWSLCSCFLNVFGLSKFSLFCGFLLFVWTEPCHLEYNLEDHDFWAKRICFSVDAESTNNNQQYILWVVSHYKLFVTFMFLALEHGQMNTKWQQRGVKDIFMKRLRKCSHCIKEKFSWHEDVFFPNVSQSPSGMSLAYYISFWWLCWEILKNMTD